MFRFGILFVAFKCPAAAPTELASPAKRIELFNRFQSGWRANWQEQSPFSRPTLQAVANDNGRPVLHAQSAAANSGIVRRLPSNLGTYARLSWHWKIRRPLSGRQAERTRAGDDYAARVFVVFESSWLPLRTRAINYVRSAAEREGEWTTRRVGSGRWRRVF
jgi:hypothetical protein